MPASEPARHALYARLEEVLGPEHAETLMTHLPAQPSLQLATRSDIDRLEGRIEQLAAEVREMHGVMRDQLRTYTLTTVGSMTALTGVFAVVVSIIS